MIAALKAAHIIALSIWCAGLILLPIVLHIYGRRPENRTQAGFAELRWLSHYGYTAVVTPAAVLAVTFGTILIFALEVLDAWMLAKLIAVSGMVLVHAWMGHVIVQAGEGQGAYRTPMAGLSLLALVPLIGVVLWLVLAKPALDDLIALLPSFLQEPRGNQIPARFDPL